MNKQVFRDLSEMTSMKTKVYMYIHPCNHICTYILGCVKIREVPTIHVCMCIYVYVCVHIYTYTHIRGSLWVRKLHCLFFLQTPTRVSSAAYQSGSLLPRTSTAQSGQLAQPNWPITLSIATLVRNVKTV